MSKNRAIHEQEYGISDILQPLALVEDGVIALKDGGLLGGWKYTGRDYASVVPEVAEAVRDQLGLLLNFGKGWVYETNVIRSECTEYEAWGTFSDSVSELIDIERCQNYTKPHSYYKSDYYQTLTYFPPSTAAEKAKGFFYESAEQKGLAQQALDYFSQVTSAFESSCSSFLDMTRLKAVTCEDEAGNSYECNDLLRYISRCLTGIDRPFLSPDTDADLDWLLDSAGLTGGTRPSLGGKHLRVLTIKSIPKQIYPLALSALEHLPMAFRLHGRSILLDRPEAQALHEANRKRHSSKVVSFLAKVTKQINPSVDPRALQLASDAVLAKSVADDPNECSGLFSARIVLLRDSEEQADADVRTIQQCLEPVHLPVRDETYNVNDAWAGSLPGHAFFDIRQVPLRGFNIASMTPLHSVWRGETFHPSPKMPKHSSPLMIATTTGMTPVRHHLHVQDVGHTAVFGPTGNGKSTLFGAYAVSLQRYQGARIYMFDRMRTQYVLCKALNGTFYDFVRDPTLTLCPLQHLDTEADIGWASNYIEILCRENGLQVKAEHRDAIGKGLERLRSSRRRSMTHFQSAVQHREIVEALQLYTIGNPISAKILDGESDSINDCHFSVFEMAELMQMHRSVAIAVWLYLCRRIERSLDASHPTAIFMDEARRLIHDDMTAATIEDWSKEIRNLNGFCMLALQGLKDTMSHERLRSVVAEQYKTAIFLPNKAALTVEDTRLAYRQAGLNDAQIYQIATAQPKRDYCLWSDGHFQTLSFDFRPVSLAFIAANSDRDRDEVNRLSKLQPDSWQADWLRSKGLPEWAEHYEFLEHRRKGVERAIA